jgi:hypothetical protein
MQNLFLVRKESLELSGSRYVKFKGNYETGVFGILGVVEYCGIEESQQEQQSRYVLTVTVHSLYLQRLMKLLGYLASCESFAVPAAMGTMKFTLDGE